jgi:uncharacterized surface protein with fasciclin (FAS1) repeats
MVNAVGLASALEGYKPVTLFAPSDEAFNRFHQKVSFNLLKDVDLLRELLAYHIIPLKLTRASLKQLASSPLLTEGSTNDHVHQGQEQTIELPTLSGHTLLARFSNNIRVQDISVLEPELDAENGVVHPIEYVLWPPDIDEASFHGTKPTSFRR